MSGPPPPEYLTQEQIDLFEKLSNAITRRRLTTPAVLFLESVRPLNFIGSQAMVFFAPMVHALFTARQYDLIQQALEHRETIAWLLDLLEAKEEIAAAEEKEIKKKAREEKRARRERKQQRRT